MKEVVIVAAGAVAFALDGAFAVVLADERKGNATQPGQVLGRVPGASPTLVLPEDHVEHPVLPVLNAPVAADGARQPLYARLAAADVVGHLVALLAVHDPHPAHRDHHVQPRPLVE